MIEINLEENPFIDKLIDVHFTNFSTKSCFSFSSFLSFLFCHFKLHWPKVKIYNGSVVIQNQVEFLWCSGFF